MDPSQSLNLEDSDIPLADEDAQVILPENSHGIPPAQQLNPDPEDGAEPYSSVFLQDQYSPFNSLDPDASPDEQEEKARLISQVLELQNTLDDLSQRVDNVKEENLRLKSENQVLGQYIENLMTASSVFQSTTQTGKKGKK
ncbi:unnamed protein product [Darwinula stevensoni]|uniref:Short coiled-coil protein n=1 Tax=Darwinula stevensoni TaxID=69355 RepID=A0A7R8WY62_9CRUS|nr:unnamed protein product [Darwinula stevensoni]CAG0878987.1 unnamed protein product [Darwinula stevensoni]